MKEKVYFKNSKGDKLCGILSNPTDDVSKPIIILCHGLSSNKDTSTYMKLENVLNKKNISTFRFDFYAHGESEGKFEEITVSEGVDDVLKATAFLKNKEYSKIGLIASSYGGAASIMAASKTNDLFVLCLIAPASDYEEVRTLKYGKEGIKKWKEKGYIYYEKKDGRKLKCNYSFFEDIKDNKAYDVADKIKIPTMIVHGDNDPTVPIEQSKKICRLIKNCKLEIIKGAGHSFKYEPENQEKIIRLISDFIIKNI